MAEYIILYLKKRVSDHLTLSSKMGISFLFYIFDSWGNVCLFPHNTISGRIGHPPIQRFRFSQLGQEFFKCFLKFSNSTLFHASFMV